MSNEAKPVDVSKLREGDVVLLEAVVRRTPIGDCYGLSAYLGNSFLNLKTLKVVSVEPRPLVVGDKVRTKIDREQYRIAAIDGDAVWIRHSLGNDRIVTLEALERVL